MNTKIPPQDFYNKFAPDYDSTLQGAQINAQYVNEAVKIFHQYHRGIHGSILDIGCGTSILKDLLEGELEYTGIDISENMLTYANQRGYQTIHSSIEEALPKLPDSSYDFVFSLGALLFIEDINSSLQHIKRISRQAALFNLDCLSQEHIDSFKVSVFDHSKVPIAEAQHDYLIRGWTSPSTGATIQTRMIYIAK